MTSVTLEQETPQRLDLLNRQEFIDQLLEIVGILSKNKKSVCFSINGQWGVGKTYVLDMFSEKARQYGQEGTVLDKYIIFRYDCWEHDYYEEPLVAIVATILEQYDQQVKLLGETGKQAVFETIKRAFCHVGKNLIEIGSAKLKSLAGIEIDSDKIIQFVKGAQDIAQNTQERIEENHEYDKFFLFKIVLRELKNNLAKLAEDHTVLIVVDELDRCLPEYTIRILERLHHLFSGIPNIQVIIATDRKQLEHTVRRIYGTETDARKYLKKFISFELNLPCGSIDDFTQLCFGKYFDQFEWQSEIQCRRYQMDFVAFRRVIFESIDMQSSA